MSDKYKIPNKLAKVKLYSEVEFLSLKGAANRQERLLAAVVDNREDMLSPTDQAYLDLLRDAFKIMSKELSPIIRRRKLEKLLQISSRGRTLQIISDVNVIFCDIDETTRDLNRIVTEHRISKHIDKLEKKFPNSPSIPMLYKLLAKIQGTDTYKEEGINYDDIQIPIPNYTTDINAIPDMSGEDVEHEEIE